MKTPEKINTGIKITSMLTKCLLLALLLTFGVFYWLGVGVAALDAAIINFGNSPETNLMALSVFFIPMLFLALWWVESQERKWWGKTKKPINIWGDTE